MTNCVSWDLTAWKLHDAVVLRNIYFFTGCPNKNKLFILFPPGHECRISIDISTRTKACCRCRAVTSWLVIDCFVLPLAPMCWGWGRVITYFKVVIQSYMVYTQPAASKQSYLRKVMSVDLLNSNGTNCAFGPIAITNIFTAKHYKNSVFQLKFSLSHIPLALSQTPGFLCH